jgi:hypothetical protein
MVLCMLQHRRWCWQFHQRKAALFSNSKSFLQANCSQTLHFLLRRLPEAVLTGRPRREINSKFRSHSSEVLCFIHFQLPAAGEENFEIFQAENPDFFDFVLKFCKPCMSSCLRAACTFFSSCIQIFASCIQHECRQLQLPVE